MSLEIPKKKENLLDRKSKTENTNDTFILAEAEANEIEIRPEDRNSEGRLLATPGGPESNLSEKNWKLVRTPSFKKWFGDWQNNDAVHSEIIDENGEPALLYHTTDADLEDFESFSDEKAGPKRQEKNNKIGLVLVETGFYFTGGNYEYGKNRLSVFINAKVKEVEKHSEIMNLENKEALRLQEQGYTGLIHTFSHSESEINDLKKEFRRKYAPKSISEKLFFGFNKLLNTGKYIDALMERLVEKKPLDTRDRVLGKNALGNIIDETRKLREVKKDTKSPFFEVCVLNSNQVMIVNKEKDYKTSGRETN